MKKTLTIEEIRERFLCIMDEIDRVCRENGISYFLTAGTLLGAVRHKGFIPWDDDVDIGMKRDEYNKFLKAWDKGHKKEYKILHCNNYDNYLWGFAKIIDTNTDISEFQITVPFEYGLFIDIFPYDEASYDTEEDIKKDNETILAIYRRYMINFIRYFIPRKKYASICNWFLCKDKNRNAYFKINTSEIVKQQTQYLENFPKNKKNRVMRDGVSNPPESYNHYGVNWFDETYYVPFEDRQYPIPKHYHEILTTLYGDYMTPPPKKEQKGHHFPKAKLR